MKIVGIVCEYNPIHMGHILQIEQTRKKIAEDCAVVCVMSGNFVQRGDLAVFSKHARAEAAIQCGADLVIELPVPYALSSAEGFANAGIVLLDSLGICDFISFGSESGDITALQAAADAIVSPGVDAQLRDNLSRGLSYAAARQVAAEAVLGRGAELLKSSNNILAVEYLKALRSTGSKMRPITITRTGAEHDSATGCSASAIRSMLSRGEAPWQFVPGSAADIFAREIAAGRGPVFSKSCEIAMLARLRSLSSGDFAALPDASEGLDRRIMRCVASAATVSEIVEAVKTKRYAMSRIRRMLMCACLGITAQDTALPPPYIRVLAASSTGVRLLKAAKHTAALPIITKPAVAKKLAERAKSMFLLETSATDFYVLAYQAENERRAGQEWSSSPRIAE